MTHETTVVGVRLTAEEIAEIAEIERVADGRGRSKSDAMTGASARRSRSMIAN